MRGPDLSRRDTEVDEEHRPLLKLVLELVLGAAVLVGLVSLLAHYFRAEIESLGRAFVEHFGYLGFTLGTYIADGLHFPLPPQFYMLASITSGRSAGWTILAISIGSIMGGITAYAIARKASGLPFFERLVARTRGKVEWLYERYGYTAVAIGSLTPIPYSFLCYVAGGYRMPIRIFFVLALFRIPKIILYFYLVKVGWTSGT